MNLSKVQRITRKHLSNWREVYQCYADKKPLPTLRLRNGMTIKARGEDDVAATVFEIFERRCYTGDGFYRPQPTDVVMDIGANIGVFAIYLSARAPGIRVECFEPWQPTYRRLLENISDNHLERTVQAHPIALGGSCGTITLLEGRTSAGSSMYEASPNIASTHTSQQVACLNLQAAIAHSGLQVIDLLKIDAEGAEITILESAPQACLRSIKKIVFECHSDIHPSALVKVTRCLTRNSFTVSFDTAPPYGRNLAIVKANNTMPPTSGCPEDQRTLFN